MALNNFGLGLEFTAKDAASAAVISLGKNLGALQKTGKETTQVFEDMTGRTRDLTTGRFAKAPEGILDPGFMSQVGGTLKGVSVAMLGMSATILGGMGVAAHASAEFNAGLTELGTLVDKAKFPISSMNTIVKEMMGTYGGDAKTQISALYQGISAGAGDAAKATALLNAANQLSIAGNTDQATAITGLTKILNNYNMDFAKAGDVTDAFLTAVQGGLTTVGELGNAVGEVAASAKGAGISMEELIGALGTAATLTRDTAGATAGLKAAMSGIAHPTSEASKEAAKLGIKFDSANLRAKGLAGFLKEITSSSKFTADSMNQLFGSLEAANTMSALAADNMSAYNGMMDSMSSKSGKGKKAFDEMSMSLKQQGAVLQSNLQILAIDIGDAIAPITGFLVGLVRTVIVGFNKLGPTVKKIVAYVGIAVGVFAGLIGSTVGVALAIAGLVAMGKVLLVSLAAVAAIVVVLAAVFIPLIAAGALLYMMWSKNIGGIADKMVRWFEKIKLAFSALGQALSDGAFSGAVQEELSKAENAGIKQFAINVFLWFSRIKNFFMAFGEAFEKGLAAMGPTVDKIGKALERLAGHFGATATAASTNKETFQKWGAAGAKAGEFLIKIIDWIAIGILSLISFGNGVADTFSGMRPALSAFADVGAEIGKAFRDLFAVFGVGKGDADANASLWYTFGQILGFVATTVLGALTFQLRIVAGVLSWLGGLVSAVGAIFEGAWNGMILGGKIVSKVLSGDLGGALDALKEWFENLGNTVIKVFAKIIGGAAGLVDGLTKAFGVDLGLKAKVEGVAGDLTGSASQGRAAALPMPTQASTNLATSAPGVAAARQPLTAPTPSGVSGPSTLNATLNTKVMLNEQVLGEAVEKFSKDAAARGFAPTTSPTG